MSLNQSRTERSDSSQYRKSGRSGGSAQPRNFSGGSGKGGWTAPPPSSSASATSNRSFKKSNNAQGGQSRASGWSVNSDSSNASASHNLPNGSHLQPALHGLADAQVSGVTAKPPTDTAAQRSVPTIPKSPSSQPAAPSSEATAPATPVKAPGDSSRAFHLQFGSISPGFVNGMQIPARTSSAPPNLDEQKRAQARHDSSRAVSTFPIPSVPKQQFPKKDGGAGNQSNSGEAHQVSKGKKEVQISSAAPLSQIQKAVHPMPGVSLPMPFPQPQVPVQFGGASPQIQSQGMTASSFPMSVPISSQLPQQLFVPGLQAHPMQPQGIIHPGQGLNFTPQMGPQLTSQLGNLNIPPQFAQPQAGKFGGIRKPVKITHPDTHEELRLDKKSDSFVDGVSSTQMSHSNVPQSQPIASVPPSHAMNYYPNYNPNSIYFTGSSVPLTGNQITSSSQAPRFSYPLSQGPQTVSFMTTPPHSYSNKNSSSIHSVAEPSTLEHSRDVHNAISSGSSASSQVTVKHHSGLHMDKVAEPSVTISSPAEKAELREPGATSSTQLQRDSEVQVESSAAIPGQELHVAGQQCAAPSHLPVKDPRSNSLSSSPITPLESTVVATHGAEGRRKETVSRSDSSTDQQKKQIKNGHSQTQHQVSGQSTCVSNLPHQSLDLTKSSTGEIAETVDSTTATPSSTGADTVESTRDQLPAQDNIAPEVPELKTDGDVLGLACGSKTFDTSVIDGSMGTNHYASQRDSSPKDEPLRLGKGGREKGGDVANGPKPDHHGYQTSLESVPSKSSELVNHSKPNSVLKATTVPDEVESVEISSKDLEDPVDPKEKGDPVGNTLVISTSLVPNATNTNTSFSSPGSSTFSDSDTYFSRSDSLDSHEAVITKSVLSNEAAISVSTTAAVSQPTLKHEGEGTEDINSSVISVSAALSKEKPLVELNRSKSTGAPRKKKFMKEILQKADAAGTTSDLYFAYKVLEGKKDTVVPPESMDDSPKEGPVDVQDSVVTSEKGGESKAEPDDWEDAADISTPKLEIVEDGEQVHGAPNHLDGDGNGITSKKYSRDFLLKFKEQYVDLPQGFEISSDIAEALMVSNANFSRESYSSPGRVIDRPSGGSRSDRRGSGMNDDDKWIKLPGPLASGRDHRIDGYGGNFRPGQGGNYGVLRNPRAQVHSQYAGGILAGPMQSLGSQGGMQRNTPDSDRWQRATGYQKGLIPSPQTPSQIMHKAEKKYEVGKVTDEEEAKQRQIKSILNKLTPQNFEKLFEQVKAVNIDNAETLSGVISQIFDKALMEPTFCEMYANFCFHLAGELPDFNEDNEKVTFKRLLLNKCQEEFERGEREQAEADRDEQEGEIKQTEEEREEKRIKARRRMLGNIRLIGELYKKRMLTERIMHECIKKMLGERQTPDEEDIEALCKLMSTIGEIIDHSRAKEHMDAYFDRMSNLSNNMELSSRVRFMLKDAIDLRKNKWQQRRKVEGPKKIEEVHRDAAQERQVQANRLARGSSFNSGVRNRQPMDFGSRGTSALTSPDAHMGGLRGLPSQSRGLGSQDFRTEDRHPFESRTPSVPLAHRPVGEDSITLGPQGGLGRAFRGPPLSNIPLADAPSPGDSRRMLSGPNNYNSILDRPVYGREDVMTRSNSDRFVVPSELSTLQDRNMNYGNRSARTSDRSIDRSLPNSPTVRGREPTPSQNVPSDKLWPEEKLRDMSINAIKEFYSAKDEKEVALCVKDLNAPSFYPTMISIWVNDSFERKDKERDLLAKLLINLSKPRVGMLNHGHLIKGFESVLTTLEDAVSDAPKAGEFFGDLLAKVIMANVVHFKEIGQLIYKGGEEKGRLVEIGLAAEIVGTILDTIKTDKGESLVNEIRTSSSLKLENFRPSESKRSWRLDKYI